MTREEAIRLLTEWAEQCRYEAICKAAGLAVAALRAQQEPTTPLTLEELRKLDGEPVWIKRRDGCISGWAILGNMVSPYGVYFGTARGGLRLPYEDYGKTWLAYRRKPEEGTP